MELLIGAPCSKSLSIHKATNFSNQCLKAGLRCRQVLMPMSFQHCYNNKDFIKTNI